MDNFDLKKLVENQKAVNERDRARKIDEAKVSHKFPEDSKHEKTPTWPENWFLHLKAGIQTLQAQINQAGYQIRLERGKYSTIAMAFSNVNIEREIYNINNNDNQKQNAWDQIRAIDSYEIELERYQSAVKKYGDQLGKQVAKNPGSRESYLTSQQSFDAYSVKKHSHGHMPPVLWGIRITFLRNRRGLAKILGAIPLHSFVIGQNFKELEYHIEKRRRDSPATVDEFGIIDVHAEMTTIEANLIESQIRHDKAFFYREKNTLTTLPIDLTTENVIKVLQDLIKHGIEKDKDL